MPGNNPLQDDTGHEILAAVQDLTAAVRALTQQLSDAGDTLDAGLRERRALATCLQSGRPYVAGAGYNGG